MFLAIPDTIYIPVEYICIAVAVIAALVVFSVLKGKKKNAAAEAVAEAAAPAVAVPVTAAPAAAVAPGSAGKLKLYDTPPKTAAMVMAIVADKLGKPINELRFVSIKEV